MKVLILNHNQENFGTYYRCKMIGTQLEALGHEVLMVCASGKKFDLSFKKKKVVGNFHILTLPRVKYHTYFTGQIIRMFLTIPIALFGKYDLMYAFTVAQPQIAVPAFLAKKIRRKPLIVDWDDLWGGGFAEAHSSIVTKVLGWCEAYFPTVADRVTYVSEFIGRRIEDLNFKMSVHKIPNGCNTKDLFTVEKYKAREHTKLPSDKKLLVSIGNTYTDSLGTMLEAFKRALEERQDIMLVFVGNLQVDEKFKHYFKILKNNIIKIGSVPYSEIPYYLSSADVLVLPMDDDPVEKARFPMRFGDYLCAGRPIVSNAVGEVKYYLDKYSCGYVSPATDVLGFADNILESVSEGPKSEIIGKKALDLAKGELNWKNIGENIDKIIKLLI